VTFGGSDPQNATEAVIASMPLVGDLDLTTRVVIGGSSPRAESWAGASRSLSDSIELIHDASNLAELMSWSDMAISGAGVTALELAFMGVPTLVLVVAENQTSVAEYLDRQRIAIRVGRAGSVTPHELAANVAKLAEDYERRILMSRTSQRLVDGYGVYRVLHALGLVPLRLETACANDSKLLWEWANDPAVRQASFITDPIEWEAHQLWVSRKLSDPASLILIAYDARDEPVGQIRFDSGNDSGFNVSISVPADRRGLGYGRKIIEEGMRYASEVFPGKLAHALIRQENQASVRLFQQAGFRLLGEEIIAGHHAFHYVRSPLAKTS
jgi:RimJ/RimL family protein N-acetyltransferase